ncbi:hypothetical protein MHB_0010570 [Pseudomonas fluorescens BBc6R8]|uniref:hypothetical protein n=1 Tax=Pseudomonas fluorescens TaxID=294 RepID=UPI000281CDCE|nr:hypothetical protein [Pseudomonas fluorescens]QQD56658.1 hypothetical protein MHB_0010570 [Pseudomonas fluorescens BBc6R8]
MKRNAELSEQFTETLRKTEVGKQMIINFRGAPTPVEVKYTFSGGWVVTQTLIPGMPLVITRGEDGYLEQIDITLLPHEGLS